MTIVEKNIRGSKYRYFQDSVKIETGNKIVTTFISKDDVDGQKFLDANTNDGKTPIIKKNTIYLFDFTHTIYDQ